MFRTITSNPLLSAQGAFLVFSQEDTKDGTKKRYVILNSDTLQIRKTFQGEDAKDNLGKEIRKIEAEYAAKQPGSLYSILEDDTPATDDTSAE